MEATHWWEFPLWGRAMGSTLGEGIQKGTFILHFRDNGYRLYMSGVAMKVLFLVTLNGAMQSSVLLKL